MPAQIRPAARNAFSPRALQALEQTRLQLANPAFWLAMAGVAVALTAADPTTLAPLIDLPQRLLHWGVLVVVPALVMTCLSVIGRVLIAGGAVPAPLGWLTVGMSGIVPVTAVVHQINRFHGRIGPDVEMSEIFVYVGPIVLVLTVAINALHCALTSGGFEALPSPADTAATPPEADLPPAAGPMLFNRLPAALGTEVICLRARDHYLDVTTTMGQATVLMRLRDGEQDLPSPTGMRVHRSWWVDLRHVEASDAEGGSLVLRLRGGLKVPVARSQRAAVLAALAAIPAAPESPEPADRSAGHPPAA